MQSVLFFLASLRGQLVDCAFAQVDQVDRRTLKRNREARFKCLNGARLAANKGQPASKAAFSDTLRYKLQDNLLGSTYLKLAFFICGIKCSLRPDRKCL